MWETTFESIINTGIYSAQIIFLFAHNSVGESDNLRQKEPDNNISFDLYHK